MSLEPWIASGFKVHARSVQSSFDTFGVACGEKIET